MGYTLQGIGSKPDWHSTAMNMRSYHRRLLEQINAAYESYKFDVDSHFKEMIKSKRDELSELANEADDDDARTQAITSAFTRITDQHAETLETLRQALDEFMEKEVHSDLQKAAKTLSH
jgi:vacuolar-type H+-ATPase subunit I/STV1